MNHKDEILKQLGTIIENWKLICISPNKKNGKLYVTCECCCGKIKEVDSYNLLDGKTKSCGCIRVIDKKSNARNQVLARYRLQAKKRNISWKLTNEEAIKFFTKNCYYCGSCPNNCVVRNSKNFKSIFTYNGIDRVDNKKGYILENCVSCCIKCNNQKSNKSKEEFLEHIKLIAIHQKWIRVGQN